MSLRYKGGFIQAFFDPTQPGTPSDVILFSWGNNGNGQLALGNITSVSSPTQVGNISPWLNGATGNEHVLFTKTTGELFTWGQNNYGQLGQNDRTKRSSPVQVGALTTWLNVGAAQYTSAAIKTDGTLWTWGRNENGQSGQANVVNTSSPVQVGGLTNWASISGGLFHFCALKSDGTLWSWGNNNGGQLGLNISYASKRSSPVQVGALTTWAKISCAAFQSSAIKTDGTLWVWGVNDKGQLGQNNIIYRSSPVQVGVLTTWSKISANYFGFTAIKTDGTLWAWGANSDGQLGQNDVTTRSSPVQIGSLTTWSSVTAPFNSSVSIMALKTDGTLWSWGYNSTGSLGQNNTSTIRSPVQIGSQTWTSIVGGGPYNFGIRLT